MIVAAYRSGNALWATVIPVASMMRFGGFSEQQQKAKKSQEKTDAFATMLISAENALDAMELNGVEYRA